MAKILFLFLLLSIAVCNQTTSGQNSATNKSEAVSGWQTLNQPTYSIQYPEPWKLDQSGEMGTSFCLFAPLKSDTDNFRTNINLIIQDLSGQNIDLNKFMEISFVQLKKMLTNYTLAESKKEKNNNGEYYKIVYSGDQGIFHLKFEQYCWTINDKTFVLTFTSKQDQFSGYLETGEKVMNSFQLKK
jgi:hypothetical protein